MIGNILRQERERQGLTIEDIGKSTSIRTQYLTAIEDEDFGVLPGEVYTKGFIRNYAMVLNLDANACVQRYISENHPEQAAAAEAAREAGEAKGEDAPSDADRGSASVGESFPQEKKRSGSGFGMAAAVVALVAVLGGGAYFLFGSDGGSVASNSPAQVQSGKKPVTVKQEQAEVKPGVSDAVAAPAPKTEAATKAPQAAEQASPAGKAGSDVQVTAKFTGRCWTKVIADGETVYEGTAEPGKTMAWNGKERISITAGNAGAVEIIHNGKSIGKAGDIGQVVDKVFTRDAVN